MTGYSHGEAGVGLALLELHRMTGRQDFLDGYYGALAYEDRFYSARRGNWPDLRTWVADAAVDDLPVWGVTWCHGAPGILLSRLRALSLLPELSGRLLPQIQGALRATLEAVKTRRAGPRQDATLCHGGAGYGDILLLASALLGQQALHEEALQIGMDLLKEEQPGASYLTGVPSGGPNPSLLIGTAGIGHFFLRLHEPSIPSLLVSPYPS
jgi:lantibiotic modifying enzyme